MAAQPFSTHAGGGWLSTHVLDTAHGVPAQGMAVALYVWQGAQGGASDKWHLLREVVTNTDGRVDGPLLSGSDFQAGRYRLVFDVAGYFQAHAQMQSQRTGSVMAEPAFLGQVPIDFGVADASAHYHVPLLVSLWSYSTYRGS